VLFRSNSAASSTTTLDVLEAAELLEKQNISVMVVGMPTVCPLDEELILKAAHITGKLMTVEEHYQYGGLGTMVAEVCSREYPVPIKMHGIPKSYATSGPYDELLKYYRLDAEGIAATAIEFIKK
jgi:transketolase